MAFILFQRHMGLYIYFIWFRELSFFKIVNNAFILCREYVTARIPVNQLEAILDTQFYWFDVAKSADGVERENVVRTLEYTIPQVLIGHVVSVLNTADFPLPSKTRKGLTRKSSPNVKLQSESILRAVSTCSVTGVVNPPFISRKVMAEESFFG